MRALAYLLLAATALVLLLTWTLSKGDEYGTGLSNPDGGGAKIEDPPTDEVRVGATAAGAGDESRSAIAPNVAVSRTLGPIVRSSPLTTSLERLTIP